MSFLEKVKKLTPEQQIVLKDKAEKDGTRYGLYPLSPEQRNMWFIYQYNRNDLSYVSRYQINFDGEYSSEIIDKTFKYLIRRHSALRTVYPVIAGKPFQMVTDTNSVPHKEIRLTGDQNEDEKKIMEEAVSLFDLETEIPVRYVLFVKNSKSAMILISFHHIAFDGWSAGIFRKEFFSVYRKLSEGENPEFREEENSYIDYAVKMNSGSVDYSAELKYWNEHFDKSIHEIPFKEHDEKAANGNVLRDLSDTLCRDIREYSSQSKFTVSEICLAVLGKLLCIICGTEKVNIGIPVLNRETRYLDTMGYFSNTTVFQYSENKDADSNDLFGSVHRQMTEVLDASKVPLEIIVKEFAKESESRRKLFNVIYSFQGKNYYGGSKKEFISDTRADFSMFYRESKSSTDFAVTFHVIETEDGIRTGIGFQSKYLTKETAADILEQYEEIMDSLIHRRKTTPEMIRTRIETDLSDDASHRKNVSGNAETIEKIYEIWKSVLGDIPYEVSRPFFSLGGTSFQSFQVLEQLNTVFETDISIADFFQYSSIGELAGLVDEITSNDDAVSGTDEDDMECLMF